MQTNTRLLLASILVGLGATLLAPGGPASAQSTPVTACGQVLAVPGHYHLTGNLGPCPGKGVVITASDVHLSLGGFTISGPGCVDGASGIDIPGNFVAGGLTGVRVHGGTVKDFTDGINVHTASLSRVTGMQVVGSCIFGIAINVSPGTVLDTNVVTDTGLDGIGIGPMQDVTVRSNHVTRSFRWGIELSNFAGGNTIRDNIVDANGLGNVGGGIVIFNGNGNTVRGNAVNGNGSGIFVLTDDNTIRDNTVNGNEQSGISLQTGGLNTVRNNTATGNGIVDLQDVTVACGTNSWRNNVFITDRVAFVSDGGPGTGCIR